MVLRLFGPFDLEEEAKCAAMVNSGCDADFAAMEVTQFAADIETQARTPIHLGGFWRRLPIWDVSRIYTQCWKHSLTHWISC
jgi:hypothetical protein